MVTVIRGMKLPMTVFNIPEAATLTSAPKAPSKRERKKRNDSDYDTDSDDDNGPGVINARRAWGLPSGLHWGYWRYRSSMNLHF